MEVSRGFERRHLYGSRWSGAVLEIVINDQVFYQAGELVIPAGPDSGVDMRQDPSGPGPKKNDGGKEGDAKKESQWEDDPMEGKGDKMSEFDLGALTRDLLEYEFIETEVGGTNETLVLMTLSSFMSPTKEPPVLSLVESGSLAEAHQRKTGEIWTRVAFMEGTWGIIRTYGTQSVMNQSIMREVTENMVLNPVNLTV